MDGDGAGDDFGFVGANVVVGESSASASIALFNRDRSLVDAISSPARALSSASTFVYLPVTSIIASAAFCAAVVTSATRAGSSPSVTSWNQFAFSSSRVWT